MNLKIFNPKMARKRGRVATKAQQQKPTTTSTPGAWTYRAERSVTVVAADRVDRAPTYPLTRPVLLSPPSRLLTQRLVALHGKPERTADPLNEYNITQGHHQSSVLDSLVRTILSQNTTDKTSIRAFASLKETFPDWEAVRTADVGDVAESIRVGGLADAKAGWLVVDLVDRRALAHRTPTDSILTRAARSVVRQDPDDPSDAARRARRVHVGVAA